MSVRVVTYGFVGVLAGLLLLTSAAVVVSRFEVSRAEDQLRSHWLPAQTTALSLETSYVDEETGLRGYLLSGEARFLEPFEQAKTRSAQLSGELSSLLRSDPVALGRLRQVAAAHGSWLTLAEQELAARGGGPLDQAALSGMAAAGQNRFDVLRSRLTALADRTAALANRDLDRIAAARERAALATVVAVVVALVVAGLAVPVLRRLLNRPLGHLLGRVQQVAGGDYDRDIPPEGPVELATIAEAVDRMRESLLANTRALVEARHELTLRDERERIAADLHDLTIQRVFALGLSLSAAASRDRAAADLLGPLIDETDRIIQEVRSIIFDVSHPGRENLGASVRELVRDSARPLGFAPVVSFRGPVEQLRGEVADALLAVLHESLSNVARHARATRADVTVAVTADQVVLTVADDGRGLDPARPAGGGTRNMEARAARLGGSVSVRDRAGGGTEVEWCVPVAV